MFYAHAAASATASSRAVVAPAGIGVIRIMKEMRPFVQAATKASDEPGKSKCRKDNGFELEMADEEGENALVWDLHLFDFEPSAQISQDLQSRRLDRITLRLVYPEDYPASPPFVHVLRPRLKGSFVQPNGGLCMEMLLPSSWAPSTNVESLAVNLRTMLLTGNELGLKKPGDGLNGSFYDYEEPDYTLKEAQSDFKHIVEFHNKKGWSNFGMRNG